MDNPKQTVVLDESWQRYPDARIRMREQDLRTLVRGLSRDGVFISGHPRAQLLDDGILINFNTNTTAHGRLIALPIDIFIPCDSEILDTDSISIVEVKDSAELATEENGSPMEMVPSSNITQPQPPEEGQRQNERDV